jgi:hypothetical protein
MTRADIPTGLYGLIVALLMNAKADSSIGCE